MCARIKTYSSENRRQGVDAINVQQKADSFARGMKSSFVFSNIWTWVNEPYKNTNGIDPLQGFKSICSVTYLTANHDLGFAKGLDNEEGEPAFQGDQKISVKEKEMKGVKGNKLINAIAVIIMLSASYGQALPKLEIVVEDQKVNLSAVEKKDASQIVVIPGDTIRYTITATNTGQGAMQDPEIVDPIPAGVTYIPNSASGPDGDISFSLNQGGSYMPWPPFYTVRNSKGILVKREATPDMLTHIKWNIRNNLEPGESSVMEFLVEVNR